MFKTILIANRGEIACRIIRTAKRMGIDTIAVYSEADENALHVQLADRAYLLGPAPSQESYLCIDKIIAIAKQQQVDAIHPGYGFLSENVDFAKACEKNNIVFIGPPCSAIADMGSKQKAKQIMAKAKVPLMPGYHEQAQDVKTLSAAAKKIGFPVLIKAASGGGGKGMRIVNEEKEFKDALVSAQREALKSFADDTVILEKYITNPRHIEIQVFADTHSNVIHLYERDCSIQRRYQKIIEEAPAPNMRDKTREAIASAAIDCAKAINYVGAGTVEFLLGDDEQFYFMEMNTRLQVEHPVTEMITGLDLVAWQLRIAAGEKLPLAQHEIPCNGHAMEARVYSEDPDNQFLPSIGTVAYYEQPDTSEHIRLDSGIKRDDTISPYYDPMLAKLIVWGRDRREACRRLSSALANYRIAGIKHNISFLHQISNHDDFITAKLDTHFIDTHLESLLKAKQSHVTLALLFACLQNIFSSADNKQQTDPYSPWQSHQAWRLNYHGKQTFRFKDELQPYDIQVHYQQQQYEFIVDNKHYAIQAHTLADNQIAIQLDDLQLTAKVINHHNTYIILGPGWQYSFDLSNQGHDTGDADVALNQLVAPMPGTVVALFVKANDFVTAGTPLITMEAMKMEHTINAPCDGTIVETHYAVGDSVMERSELLEFEPA